MIQTQNGIISKPGLYLQIAKLKGYTIIEYSPSLSCIFSINCKLTCQVEAQWKANGLCALCGAELSLYRDPLMAKFAHRTRIDLVNRRCCRLPTYRHNWEALAVGEPQQPSHLKYYKVYSQVPSWEPQLKQCLANYFHYQVMPVPTPQSYWRNHCPDSCQYQYQCISLCAPQKDKQEQQQIRSLVVIVGDSEKYSIRIPIHMQVQMEQNSTMCMPIILDCQIKHGFLVLLVGGASCHLHVYQLPQHGAQQENELIPPVHSLKPIQGSTTSLCWTLAVTADERVVLMGYSCIEGTLTTIITDSILNQPNNLSYTRTVTPTKLSGAQYPVGSWGQCHGDPPEHPCPSLLQVCDKGIKVLSADGAPVAASSNSTQIAHVHGQISNAGGDRVYFYQLGPGGAFNFIAFETQCGKLMGGCLEEGSFVPAGEQIDSPANQYELIYRKPAVDGCLLYLHFWHQGKLMVKKSCVW